MPDTQPEDDRLPRHLDLPEEDSGMKSPHKRPSDSESVFTRYLKPTLAILAVLTLVGIGVWLWFFLFGPDESEFAAPDQDTIQQEAEIDTEEDIPAPGGYQAIRSANPRLELTLPENWTVTEGEDDLRLESPELSITTANGKTVENAVFRLYFRQGAREVDSEYIGEGVAAIPSETMEYDDPAQGQREETVLSFFGKGTTDHIFLVFIAGNFELDVGDGLGPDYGQEDETYIIGGGYSSDELEDDLNMYSVSTEFFRSTDGYEQAIDILQSIQLL